MYGKKFIGSDSLIALSGAIAILFGSYMISPDGNLSIFTWSFFILEFSQYFFGNAVVGGLKEVVSEVTLISISNEFAWQ